MTKSMLQYIYIKMVMMFRIKARIRRWKANRKLKSSGYNSWEQYRRFTDKDVLYRATRIKEFYHGYPYVYCFENRGHQFYHWDLGFDGSSEVIDWAESNCRDKVRFDGFRCMKDYWGEWTVNEMGGGDYYFAAFKNERDYIWFTLRWA